MSSLYPEFKRLFDKAHENRTDWPFQMRIKYSHCDDGMPHPWLEVGDGFSLNGGFTLSGIMSFHDAKFLEWLWNNSPALLAHLENGATPPDGSEFNV